MRSALLAAGGMAAMLFAVSPAHAATHLDCMAQPYAGKDKEVIDKYVGAYGSKSASKNGPDSGPVLSVFSARAGTCGDQHGWAPNAIMNAVFYQLGVAMEQGVRRRSPLSAAEMARLERAVAAADQDRLWGPLEAMMNATIFGGEGAELSDDDDTYLGLVIVSSGIPINNTNSEFAGELLAAQAIQRLVSKRFESE